MRHKNQVDAFRECHVRVENQIASVVRECLLFSGGLYNHIKNVVSLVLELKSGLVQFEHLSIDVDMVLGCPINPFIL